MKRVIAAFILFCSFWLVAGMGDLPKGAVVVPEVEARFTAKVVDLSGAALDLRQFSCDGNTFLPGMIGRARLTVDFEKIASVVFEPEGERIRAEVSLRDGTQVALKMDRTRSFFGVSSFANVRIDLPDIRTISIQREIPDNP